MSIHSVNETVGARGNVNEKGVNEYTRVFQVITTAPTVGAVAVRMATGIPRRYDAYATATETDNSSLATRIATQQDDENPLIWEVTVDYGSPSTDQDQSGATEPNPVLRPAVLAWSFQKFQRAVWKDKDNKGILNSAKEFFDPPPEMDDSRPILTITRNQLTYNTAIAIDYQDAVNSDSFLGFAAGKVKVAGISAQSQVEGRYVFWSVTYEFEFRREGWKLSILDQGRNKRVGANLTPILQKDASGNAINVAVSDPVPLDGSGGELSNPTPSTAKFLDFDVYKTMPFAALHLP